MRRGSERGLTSCVGTAEDARYRSLSELVASLRSAVRVVTLEEAQKALEAIQRRLDHEVEHLRSENASLKNELERLNSEKKRLEDELRKCRRSGDERVVGERAGIADEVYSVLMEKVGRGGGETSLKEIFAELRRKNEELEGEKRELESQLWVSAKKFKELDGRVLQLERDTSVLKNEEQCVLGNLEGESQVLEEPNGLIDVDACGDQGSTWRGNDSKGGGSVSFAPNARKKLDFGTGAYLSLLAGSSRNSPVKEDRVLQGDGSPPIVEIIESDDDCSGLSEKLSGYKYRGRRNDEKGNKELKRKRGSVSSVLHESFTQTLHGMAATLKQCEQKNIKEEGSDNSLSKSTGVNPIMHENGAGSASTKSDDGNSLHKERWKYEAQMLSDFSEDDVLCMRAVCALYRRQRSKSMERSACQGSDGLLLPRDISLAEFLTGGDPEGKLKKSVTDLRDHFPEGLSDCWSIATKHFKQLFIMYRKKEDPFFPSS